MKHLIIGMDIDGVIVDYTSVLLPLLSDVCQRQVFRVDLNCWDISKALDIEEELLTSVWEKLLGSDILRDAPPIRGALAGLSTLSKHEIWLVTARPAVLQDLTLSWLSHNKVKYDHVVFDGKKDRLSVEQSFDVFVEDSLEHASAIAEAGVFSLLLDQPWNQSPVLPRQCKRVYDWDAIVQSINQLEEAY